MIKIYLIRDNIKYWNYCKSKLEIEEWNDGMEFINKFVLFLIGRLDVFVYSSCIFSLIKVLLF